MKWLSFYVDYALKMGHNRPKLQSRALWGDWLLVTGCCKGPFGTIWCKRCLIGFLPRMIYLYPLILFTSTIPDDFISSYSSPPFLVSQDSGQNDASLAAIQNHRACILSSWLSLYPLLPLCIPCRGATNRTLNWGTRISAVYPNNSHFRHYTNGRALHTTIHTLVRTYCMHQGYIHTYIHTNMHILRIYLTRTYIFIGTDGWKAWSWSGTHSVLLIRIRSSSTKQATDTVLWFSWAAKANSALALAVHTHNSRLYC
jgi:hypothetical protein